MRTRFQGYELDDDGARVDGDALWAFLSTEAYWARWRGRADVERQLENAWRIVGVYDAPTGEMVGYARAISDGVSFAYLADVYVHTKARGNGLGKELIRVMIDGGPGAELRWTLHTDDAHELYEQFGFAPPDSNVLVSHECGVRFTLGPRESAGQSRAPQGKLSRPKPNLPWGVTVCLGMYDRASPCAQLSLHHGAPKALGG